MCQSLRVMKTLNESRIKLGQSAVEEYSTADATGSISTCNRTGSSQHSGSCTRHIVMTLRHEKFTTVHYNNSGILLTSFPSPLAAAQGVEKLTHGDFLFSIIETFQWKTKLVVIIFRQWTTTSGTIWIPAVAAIKKRRNRNDRQVREDSSRWMYRFREFDRQREFSQHNGQINNARRRRHG